MQERQEETLSKIKSLQIREKDIVNSIDLDLVMII